MDTAQVYVLIAVLVLAVIAGVMVFVRGKKAPQMTRLNLWAFIFIFAGIIFNTGEDRFWGYALITTGGVLALIDIIRKLNKK